jgi:hypothetical protein
MPDESCRKCGKPLYVDKKCKNCPWIFQEICMCCGQNTLPKYHSCKIANENTVLV